MGIIRLAQIKNYNSNMHGSYWLSLTDLRIPCALDGEWESYIAGVCHLGIRLRNRKDILVWDWDKKIRKGDRKKGI